MPEEDIRIGVFVCHCGTNIGGVLDVPSLAEYAKTLPHVTYSADNLYTCSEVGLTEIKENIKEQKLNRVIVASCSPRTHEPLFRAICEEAGLNPYLFEMVNIRDQDSWVHMKEPEKGLEKAKDLIRMSVYKAALLEPLERIKVSVNQSAIVIGGGISGMTAALNLGNQGFEVSLIEKEPELGGLLKSLNKVYPSNEEASKLLDSIKLIESHKKIKVYKSSVIEKVDGFIGNYKVSINQNNKINEVEAGTIIIATGATPLTPKGYYGYNGKNIISQLDLEGLLKNNQVAANNITMILCVGCRNEERKYCSNICCMSTIKNAMLVMEKNPDAHITILFQDIQAHGTVYEKYYRKAREMGVLFVKYIPEKPPVIKKNLVKVYSDLLNQEIEIPQDLVVLSTPLVANEDSTLLAKMLKVPLEENNFFLEAHVKLRPVDFATDGVFVCGSAHWPADIAESISQANAAASRASRILWKDALEVEGSTAEVIEELCIGCEACIKICPYKAITKDESTDTARVNKVICKGCGVCGASCPKKAIIIHHFTGDQIRAEILTYGGEA
ncbi:MAG: CoB--CoM heterodisulfide reductase iron-sulfur subunit A family protein [Candidatus Lokiarchaeota archaeon]|nr:CoB--CoM heterodisulfide reductase iron-sulfur subunit A family protein [Candidatus Lokiarchaeota archaeon]